MIEMSFSRGKSNRIETEPNGSDLRRGLLHPIIRNCMRQPTVKYVIFCHPYADL